MNELATKLMKAHQICIQAYPYFENAASIRQEAENRLAKDKKTAKILAVTAGVMATVLLSIPLMLLAALGSILTFAGGIAAGITMYRNILLPPALDRYEQSLAEAQEQENIGQKILDDHEEELAVIPAEYCYPMATGYLVKITQSGRAGDLNQALVMLDEQLHRWKIEEANAAILEQQEQQTQSLRGIRKSSAVNAAANVISAASNVSRWF